MKLLYMTPLLLLYLASCSEPDYRQEWAGFWRDQNQSKKPYIWIFNIDGTYTIQKRGQAENTNEGTYSVTKTTFKVTYGYMEGSRLITGTWETMANKLVLYLDSPSSEILHWIVYPHFYKEEVIVFTKDEVAMILNELEPKVESPFDDFDFKPVKDTP